MEHSKTVQKGKFTGYPKNYSIEFSCLFAGKLNFGHFTFQNNIKKLWQDTLK